MKKKTKAVQSSRRTGKRQPEVTTKPEVVVSDAYKFRVSPWVVEQYFPGEKGEWDWRVVKAFRKPSEANEYLKLMQQRSCNQCRVTYKG